MAWDLVGAIAKVNRLTIKAAALFARQRLRRLPVSLNDFHGHAAVLAALREAGL